MKNILDDLLDLSEDLFKALDEETLQAFEAGKDITKVPQHTKEYYMALQSLRRKVEEYRRFQGRMGWR